MEAVLSRRTKWFVGGRGSIERTQDLFAQEENAFLPITAFWSARRRRKIFGAHRGCSGGAAHLSSASSLAASFLWDFMVSLVKWRVKVLRIKPRDF